MSRTQRWTWSASVLVTAAVVGALFLPLYDCALCGLYKASRSERGGCWCNERSKVNRYCDVEVFEDVRNPLVIGG
jgi:hypothetical protein